MADNEEQNQRKRGRTDDASETAAHAGRRNLFAHLRKQYGRPVTDANGVVTHHQPPEWWPPEWQPCPVCDPECFPKPPVDAPTWKEHAGWTLFYPENDAEDHAEDGDDDGPPPPPANGGNVAGHAILLPHSTPEYKAVEARFVTEAKSLVLMNVWRVQNEEAALEYEWQRSALARRGRDPNEKKVLYHTTRGHLETILAEGLDARVGTSGLLGAGIYVTDSILKASAYWKLPFNRRTMLQCSMLLGKPLVVAEGESHRALRREPKGYDSVVGNFTGQSEYVVYHNRRVIIDYIIDYEVTPGYVAEASGVIQVKKPPHIAAQPLPSHVTAVHSILQAQMLPIGTAAAAPLVATAAPLVGTAAAIVGTAAPIVGTAAAAAARADLYAPLAPTSAVFGAVRHIAFTDVPDVVITVTAENTLHAWHNHNPNAVHSHRCFGRHRSADENVTCLATACPPRSDRPHVYYGTDKGNVWTWDLVKEATLLLKHPLGERINAICIPTSDSVLITAAQDCTIRVWDLGTHVEMLMIPVLAPVLHLALANNHRTLAAACASTIYVWKRFNPRMLQRLDADAVFALGGSDVAISAVAFSADDRSLLAAAATTKNQTLCRFDLETQLPAHETQLPTSGPITPEFAVASLSDVCINVHDQVMCSAVNKTRTQIATGASDGTVRLWDISSSSSAHVFAH